MYSVVVNILCLHEQLSTSLQYVLQISVLEEYIYMDDRRLMMKGDHRPTKVIRMYSISSYTLRI